MELEVGKIYVCRNGELVKIYGTDSSEDSAYPMLSVDLNKDLEEDGDSDCYTKDGHFFHDKEPSVFDIVKEYITPERKEAAPQDPGATDGRLLIRSSDW